MTSRGFGSLAYVIGLVLTLGGLGHAPALLLVLSLLSLPIYFIFVV